MFQNQKDLCSNSGWKHEAIMSQSPSLYDEDTHNILLRQPLMSSEHFASLSAASSTCLTNLGHLVLVILGYRGNHTPGLNYSGFLIP